MEKPVNHTIYRLLILNKSQKVGVAGFEPTTSSSRTTRATKLRYTPQWLSTGLLSFDGCKCKGFSVFSNSFSRKKCLPNCTALIFEDIENIKFSIRVHVIPVKALKHVGRLILTEFIAVIIHLEIMQWSRGTVVLVLISFPYGSLSPGAVGCTGWRIENRQFQRSAE